MKSKRNTFAFILVIVGALLLIRSLFDINEFFNFIAPIGIIVFGLWLILRKKKETVSYKNHDIHININADADADADADKNTFNSSNTHTSFTSDQTTGSQQGESFTGSTSFSESPEPSGVDGRMRYSKVIGDMYIDCKDMNMQNVEVSAGIGDVEIKVHGGILQDGLNRMVISGFVGDCRIMVPQGIEMFAHCSNFVGDIEVLGRRASGFGNNVDAQTANYNTAPKKLYIAANNFIGDIKIMTI